MAKPVIPHTWTVTVAAAAGDLRADPVDPTAVESLVSLLPDHAAAVSHLPRRYSVRLTVWSHDAMEAAGDAVELLDSVRERAGLPDWPVAQLEVSLARR